MGGHELILVNFTLLGALLRDAVINLLTNVVRRYAVSIDQFLKW